jgi:hypothetical protein
VLGLILTRNGNLLLAQSAEERAAAALSEAAKALLRAAFESGTGGLCGATVM